MEVRIADREVDSSVPIHTMLDGQIGQITRWRTLGSGAHPMGAIVQRFGSNLIVLGKAFGDHYDTAIGSKDPDLRVRILPKGTLLEIV